jgi:hypothetical protein
MAPGNARGSRPKWVPARLFLRAFRAVLLLFQDGGTFFVGKNGAFKQAEVGGFGGWNLDLADDLFALLFWGTHQCLQEHDGLTSGTI